MAPPSPALPTQLHERRTRLQARQHAVRQLEASRSTLLRLLTKESSPPAASTASASAPFLAQRALVLASLVARPPDE